MRILDDDIIIRLERLPDRVRGVVLESPDGCYNVYLNKDDTREMWHETMEHEKRHIKNGDLSGASTLYKVEE